MFYERSISNYMQDLIDLILSKENVKQAIQAVYSNKGAPGIDGMTVRELEDYFRRYGELIRAQIKAKKYQPQPVKRVYIPKPNSDKMRPLGIPSV